MISKTEGIVLRTLKHQDANLITTIYTKDFGIKSFLIKGYRSTRAKSRHSYFQPLSIIECVFLNKENRSLHKITESKISVYLNEVQTQPVKLSLGLAMLEIFYDTVKEEEKNEALYNFLHNIITKLDRSEKRLIQIFIYFLLHHTRHLGFFPHDQSEGAQRLSFDIRAGIFSKAKQNEDEVAPFLHRFMHSNLDELPSPYSCQQITFDSNMKRFIIKTLFDYYKFHIDGFKYPQTMKVFAEVFGE
ncbi:MAG: DNA repair protein RecO [Bacteroidia bacterium]|nr:DNA repair protein RecO [Bacteroidia bacterium]